MSPTLILLDLAGDVGLLLWGTHMVTTGVLRGYGTNFRRWLGHSLGTRLNAFLVGLAVTALLQSSTATGLMATSFTASGMIDLAPGLAVMLGANVDHPDRTGVVLQYRCRCSDFDPGRCRPFPSR
jgi:phosphate:Na+ symporter